MPDQRCSSFSSSRDIDAARSKADLVGARSLPGHHASDMVVQTIVSWHQIYRLT